MSRLHLKRIHAFITMKQMIKHSLLGVFLLHLANSSLGNGFSCADEVVLFGTATFANSPSKKSEFIRIYLAHLRGAIDTGVISLKDLETMTDAFTLVNPVSVLEVTLQESMTQFEQLALQFGVNRKEVLDALGGLRSETDAVTKDAQRVIKRRRWGSPPWRNIKSSGPHEIWALRISPFKNYLAITYRALNIEVWDLDAQSMVRTFPNRPGKIKSFNFLNDTTEPFLQVVNEKPPGGFGTQYENWSIYTGMSTTPLTDANTSCARRRFYSEDGSEFLELTPHSKAGFHVVKSPMYPSGIGEPLMDSEIMLEWPGNGTIHSGKKLVAIRDLLRKSQTFSYGIRVGNWQKWDEHRVINLEDLGYGKEVSVLKFSPDGRYLVTGNNENSFMPNVPGKQFHVWDVENEFSLVGIFRDKSDTFEFIDISSDSKWMVTIGHESVGDKSNFFIKLWDFEMFIAEAMDQLKNGEETQ